MKALLISFAAVLMACTLVLVPGTSAPASAATGDCIQVQPWNPGVPDFLELPESGPNFDFVEACAVLSACYDEGAVTQGGRFPYVVDRFSCEQLFLGNMRHSCSEMWPSNFSKRVICHGIAELYYDTMRVLGVAYFRYCSFC